MLRRRPRLRWCRSANGEQRSRCGRYVVTRYKLRVSTFQPARWIYMALVAPGWFVLNSGAAYLSQRAARECCEDHARQQDRAEGGGDGR